MFSTSLAPQNCASYRKARSIGGMGQDRDTSPSRPLQLRSRPEGQRESRPGVAGSKNAGRPSRVLGGKGLAVGKKLPGPFNHDWAEGLVDIGRKLANDPSFCRIAVLIPFLGACVGTSSACLCAVWNLGYAAISAASSAVVAVAAGMATWQAARYSGGALKGLIAFGFLACGKGLTLLVMSGVESGPGSQLWALISIFWSLWLLWITIRVQRRRTYKQSKDACDHAAMVFSSVADAGV